MAIADTSRYPRGEPSQQEVDNGLNHNRLRTLLEELIFSSKDLNVRVWLDGVYTEIDDEARGDWMKGREIYFKLEGRVDRVSDGKRR
jgi:DNA polymerase III sliding clamp (beta) subunit (PCNA family)